MNDPFRDLLATLSGWT